MELHTDIQERLVGWCEYNSTVEAKTFGELLKLAIPVVTHYHSDLHHDSMWLHKHLPEMASHGQQFFYAVDPYGTSIGQDVNCVEMRLQSPGAKLYMVVVLCDDVDGRGNGEWWFAANLLKEKVT